MRYPVARRRMRRVAIVCVFSSACAIGGGDADRDDNGGTGTPTTTSSGAGSGGSTSGSTGGSTASSSSGGASGGGPTTGGGSTVGGAGGTPSSGGAPGSGGSGGVGMLDPDLDLPASGGDPCTTPGLSSGCPSLQVCRISGPNSGTCESCTSCNNLLQPCSQSSDCDILFQCYQGQCTNICPLGTTACGAPQDCVDVGHATHGVCWP